MMHPRQPRWSMRRVPAIALATGSLLCSAAAPAAPLTPNSGAMTVTGELSDGSRPAGNFVLQAVLKEGNFTGTASVTLDGTTMSGPLIAKRSYLENGRCYFRFENGRARADVSGKCDDAGLEGRFQTFTPDGTLTNGTAKAKVALAGGAAVATAPAAGRLPAGKLVCAFNEPRIAVRLGDTTQYSLRYSNMASLTLDPGGSYAAGASARGRYTRQGDKIRMTSGPWEGAVGTLENDRSGTPAVFFHIEENRRADGVHVVDPYTTRCTKSR